MITAAGRMFLAKTPDEKLYQLIITIKAATEHIAAYIYELFIHKAILRVPYLIHNQSSELAVVRSFAIREL